MVGIPYLVGNLHLTITLENTDTGNSVAFRVSCGAVNSGGWGEDIPTDDQEIPPTV
jgi:hypothetical protein